MLGYPEAGPRLQSMHVLGIFSFGITAIFWLTYGLRAALGAVRLPWLRDFAPAKDVECPRISIIFAARDEQQKLPAALATLVAIDYPRLEIVAVDDRSCDSTGQILDRFAATHPQLKVVHIRDLPKGWLGKPHALQKGYEASTGELLVFTDADVKFAHDALRRAATLLRERQLDHLSLLCDVERSGFWDTVFISFFGMGFHLAVNPAGLDNPNSRSYVGVGAFQMLRREAYEMCGGHRRLAMEVIDDMKLGKLVRMAKLRSDLAVAQTYVSVEWHVGLGNLVRGVEKNFFAGAQFRLSVVAAQVLTLLVMNVQPFVGLLFGHGWIRGLAAISVLIALCFHTGVDVVMRISPFYCLTLPLGALVTSYMILRSTAITLRQGGIIWRGNFYPLEELRRGLV
jgi:Glycosyl transferase family 2